MNIKDIKKEFPIFDNKVHNNDLVYLDSANSSQKPKVVVDRIYDFYTKEFSNVGRSVHYLAVAATNLYENTRVLVQKYINAKDPNEIVFTKGATEAINLVANTFGQKYLKEGDEILITELEHHSNYVPWHYLRKSKGVKINFADVDENGDISIESIEKKITPKTKILAITHLSNVTGAILPIKEIIQLAHSKNIPVLVDGCQGAPHLKLDMQDLDCDFYAISCHKMYGPTGLGVLYAKKKWLEELPPYQGGGGMIGEVKKEGITFGDLPNKYEAGTMATAQVIAFGESINFINKLGIEKIEERIIKPTINGIMKENMEYMGIVFIGLIKVNEDPYVIEYNVRMGDPETEVVFPRIENDLLELFNSMGSTEFANIDLIVDERHAATVIMVSGGYPINYEKNKIITGIENITDSIVFHAGTKKDDNVFLTNGGRVLAITSLAKNYKQAIGLSYKQIEKISFEKAYFRKDIGFDL